jgi:hypothetical protein
MTRGAVREIVEQASLAGCSASVDIRGVQSVQPAFPERVVEVEESVAAY